MSAPVVELPERMNAATYFVDANVDAGRGQKIAIHDAGDGSTFTYDNVLAMTNRTGNALKALDVRREERVMLLLLDSPEFAFCFFGAIKIGAVPIPVNTLLKPHDYEYLLNDSRARVLLVSEPLLAQVEPIRSQLKYLEHIVVVGRCANGQLSYSELARAASPELVPEMLSKDDACFWLYSSGTTAFPKGAVHLQHDIRRCRSLRPAHSGHQGKRPHLFGGQAVLRLRAGQRSLFPVPRRGFNGSLSGEAGPY